MRPVRTPRTPSSYSRRACDDLLAAITWFVDAGRTDEALRLATALYRFWITQQRFAEGAVWFDRVLASPGGDELLRGKAVLYAGFMPFWMGDDERAAELFGQALEIGRGLGDAPLTSQALGGLSRVALRTDVAEGRRLAGEALAVSDAADDEPGRSNALHLLGVGAQIAGDLLEAREWMTQRLALVRATGNQFLIGSEACNLSMVERQLGDLDAAEALAREALEIDERAGNPVHDAVRDQRAGVHRQRAPASSTAPRPSSARPRRSWKPRGWPGRPTNDRTTNICWRPCPRRWDRKAFERARERGRAMPMPRCSRLRPRATTGGMTRGPRTCAGLGFPGDGHDRGAAARDPQGQQVPDSAERERRQSVSPGPCQVGDRLELDPLEPGVGQRGADGGRIVALADQRMGIGGTRLHQRLQPPLRTLRHVEVGRHERVTPVDGGHDQRAARA